MIALKDGDHVYAEGWQYPYHFDTAVVGTVEGSAKKWGENPDEYVKRSLERGHEVAWTMFGGVALYGDKDYAEKERKERELNRANAIILKEGDEVIIEGRQYTVAIDKRNQIQPFNCDPIHFVMKL
jgi:hypothetical protein